MDLTQSDLSGDEDSVLQPVLNMKMENNKRKTRSEPSGERKRIKTAVPTLNTHRML